MRKIVTCIAAGLLVLGTAAVGQAQEHEKRDQRGAKQQGNRAAERGTERRREVDRGGERRRAAEQPNERRRAVDQAGERKRAVDQAGERRRAAEQASERRRAVDQAGERKRGVDQAGERRRAVDQAGERKRAVDQAGERRRAVDQAGERKRAVEQASERRRATDQAGERRRAADQANERRRAADSNNERRRAGDLERAAKQDGVRDNPRSAELRQKRLQLTSERRVRLHSAFHVDRHARIANARFARRIGTRIPRSVRLFVVPAAVVSIFPDYRDYRYVVVEDEIYIVDPGTYEIIDVMDEDLPPPADTSQVAQLTLTPAERALVLDSISPDFPETDVRLRLALGAEIPARVELNEFAPIVLDNVPRLRDLRFIVTQGSVVIVDPRDRSIELMLER